MTQKATRSTISIRAFKSMPETPCPRIKGDHIALAGLQHEDQKHLANSSEQTQVQIMLSDTDLICFSGGSAQFASIIFSVPLASVQ